MTEEEEEVNSNQELLKQKTEGKQGGGSTKTNLPQGQWSGTTTPEATVLAEHGGTSLVEHRTGQVLPFESEVQGHIGRQLRAVYDEVLSQPIPERFLELLNQLDARSEPGTSETDDLKGDA
jgi:hypothetical protein